MVNTNSLSPARNGGAFSPEIVKWGYAVENRGNCLFDSRSQFVHLLKVVSETAYPLGFRSPCGILVGTRGQVISFNLNHSLILQHRCGEFLHRGRGSPPK